MASTSQHHLAIPGRTGQLSCSDFLCLRLRAAALVVESDRGGENGPSHVQKSRSKSEWIGRYAHGGDLLTRAFKPSFAAL
jgi:hypothetical protein